MAASEGVPARRGAADASGPSRMSSSGDVSLSFEGLLQELDELRARLLDQHRRELALQPLTPGLDSTTFQAPDAEGVSLASGLENSAVSRPGLMMTRTSSTPSGRQSDHTALRSSATPSDRQSERAFCERKQTKWSQSERFLLLDSWRDKVPAARLAELEPESKRRRPVISMFTSRMARPSSMTVVNPLEVAGMSTTSTGLLSRFVMHPQSPLACVWGTVVLMMIAYDTVTVPLYTFYNFEQFPQAIEIMDWMARVFWAIDISISSVTGFHKEGYYVEMRPRKIFVWAYLTSWFFFDLLVVSADWLWVALHYQRALSPVPVLRGLRFARLIRLLRLSRLAHVINEMLLWLCHGATFLIRIIKLIVGLAISIHILASIWFGLGSVSSSGWVSQEPLMDSAALSAQYMMSVSWIITQLHGTSLVRPQTFLEMQFQSLVLLSANAFFAVFIANLVQVMMAITNAHSLQMQYTCRRYLRRRRISPELSNKLQLHFGKMSIGTALQDSQEEENKLLESLPLALQQQLHEEVRLPLLSSTRLLKTHGLCNYRLLKTLCCDAVSGLFWKPGELMFTTGDSCTRMLVAESGSSVYIPGGCRVDSNGISLPSSIRTGASTRISELSAGTQRIVVRREQCLCEASLWTRWTNRGELSAEGDCTMLAVNQADFASIVSNYEFVYAAALKYASCYLLWLNDRSAEQGVSDMMDPPRHLLEYAEAPIDTGSPFVFISHFKEEAGSDAALMDEGISRIIRGDPEHPAFRLDAPTFLDSNNLDDIRLLKGVVRSSHNLLLLLTDRVLSRPWVLIEIVTAIKYGVPIQLVQIQRPGVDFKFPTAEDIKRLADGKDLSPDAKAILRAEKITKSDLKAIGQIFGKIALPFSPHRSLTVRQAELQDIISRCEFGQSRSRLMGKRLDEDEAEALAQTPV
ncbi:unnamed protein product [Prorocentrum cordatum]|uniref:Ion transport domain-containing protein n=1 Tax=Prorocentrum cordatum TaxID=2364126 RepID=A0ABN9UYG1_9DINO|nr:unnamed protein product [Polarella glacialis]